MCITGDLKKSIQNQCNRWYILQYILCCECMSFPLQTELVPSIVRGVPRQPAAWYTPWLCGRGRLCGYNDDPGSSSVQPGQLGGSRLHTELGAASSLQSGRAYSAGGGGCRLVEEGQVWTQKGLNHFCPTGWEKRTGGHWDRKLLESVRCLQMMVGLLGCQITQYKHMTYQFWTLVSILAHLSVQGALLRLAFTVVVCRCCSVLPVAALFELHKLHSDVTNNHHSSSCVHVCLIGKVALIFICNYNFNIRTWISTELKLWITQIWDYIRSEKEDTLTIIWTTPLSPTMSLCEILSFIPNTKPFPQRRSQTIEETKSKTYGGWRWSFQSTGSANVWLCTHTFKQKQTQLRLVHNVNIFSKDVQRACFSCVFFCTQTNPRQGAFHLCQDNPSTWQAWHIKMQIKQHD